MLHKSSVWLDALSESFFRSFPSARDRPKDYQLNLSSNEMLFPDFDESFGQFVAEWSPENIRLYPNLESHRFALSTMLNTSPERLLIGPGSDQLIRSLMAASYNCCTGLIIQSPNYENYEVYAKASGIRITKLTVTGLADDSQVREISSAINKSPGSLVVVTSPDGFLGQAMSIEALTELAKRSAKSECLMMIDEAYIPFSGITHDSLRAFPHVLRLRTLSKGWGLAGLRLAVLEGHPKMITALRRCRDENAVSSLAVDYAVWLAQQPKFSDLLHTTISSARKNFRERLSRLYPQNNLPKSQANFQAVCYQGEQSIVAAHSALEANGIRVRRILDLPEKQYVLRITIGPCSVQDAVLSCLPSGVNP